MEKIIQTFHRWCAIVGLFCLSPTVCAQFSYSTNGSTITLVSYSGPGGAVTISNFVTIIGTNAFLNCSSLTRITIPNSVTSIEQTAFFNCVSLTSLTIPNSVTSIGFEAFTQCGLTNAIIGNGVTSIGDYAFASCGSLTSVYFSSNAPSADPSVFLGKPETPATVYYLPGTTGWGSTYGGAPTVLLQLLPFSYAVNGGGITITGYTGSLGAATIPGSIDGLPVTSIASNAFLNCTNLTDIAMPNTITNIGADTFEACINLTSVTVPGSVTSIGDNAFASCSSLASVFFSGNAPSADSTVFTGDNLTIYYFSGTAGWGSTFGGAPALLFPFNYATNDNAITIIDYIGTGSVATIPGSIDGLPVTSIASNAFLNSTGLTSVTIPDSITNIGAGAFEGCSSLINITIPNSVTSIGADAFASCSSLTSIYFSGNAPTADSTVFTGDNVIIYYFSGTAGWGSTFGGAPALLFPFNYAITGNAITITGYTGAGGAVTISNSISGLIVTSIGTNAFLNCTNLTSITIPNGVTSIDQKAFFNCTSLTSLNAPNSVTSIGIEAFAQCGLTNAIIGNGVTSIGSYAFASCSSLTSVYFLGTPPSADSTVFQGSPETPATVYYYYDGVTTFWGSTFGGAPTVRLQVPPFDYAINGSGITITGYTDSGSAANIPSSIDGLPVTSIGNNAFLNSTGLTSVTIPNGVTSIGQTAFFNCTALTSVAIPKGVTSIGDNAFASCSSLTGIYFGGNAPSADSTVFTGDNKATVYYIAGTTGWGTNFGGVPAAVLGEFNFMTNNGTINITGYNGLGGAVVIPSTLNGLPVATIGTSAFLNCTSLTSITIPNGVTSIGQTAFFNCTALTSLNLPNSVTSIGFEAFTQCGLTNAIIGNGVTSIGDYAFASCGSLTSIYFGGNAPFAYSTVFQGSPRTPATAYYYSGATGWGSTFGSAPTAMLNAFTYAINGNSVTITSYTGPGAAITISSSFDGLPVISIAPNAFYDQTGLISVTIPNGVTNIGASAFSDCTNLTNVTLPNSLTSLGENAFEDTGLTSVTIPSSITSIGDYEFYECASLTNIIIPSSVTNIGERAFLGCSKLTSVFFTGNAPSADSSVFAGYPYGYDPATAYYLNGTTGWSNFSNNIGVPVTLWNPSIQTTNGNFGIQNNQFGFAITGTANIPMVVEACTNLANPVWVPLQSMTLTNGLVYFSDPNWTNYLARYYGIGFP